MRLHGRVAFVTGGASGIGAATARRLAAEAAKAELAAHEVMDHVAERVAPYKKIHHIEFVDEIPRSLSGKILRRVLMERDGSS